MGFDNQYATTHQRRFEKTLVFMQKHIDAPANILDIGPENPFSKIMKESGFDVVNTESKDLDLDYNEASQEGIDAATAFEIFEHLVAPFNILNNIKADKLFASVPLKLWFANAYWNKDDPYDCHYHEFEAKQFDYLLDKAGWKIVDAEKWTSPTNQIGFRPLLRMFTPRHYIVYCERK